MDIPLQITLHGIDASDAIQATIREKAGKLEPYARRITSCRVALEIDGRHQHKGRQFRARIDVRVPGHAILVTREHHEDYQVALRDAFADARRQLEGLER